MGETDEGEPLVKVLLRMIEGERLKARLHTKGRMDTKTSAISVSDTSWDFSGIR
jgi:hypothetical protein